MRQQFESALGIYNERGYIRKRDEVSPDFFNSNVLKRCFFYAYEGDQSEKNWEEEQMKLA